MIRRKYNACMLRPEDVQPSDEDMEVIGVINPGAILVGDEVVIVARIVERPKERRWGYTAVPYREEGRALVLWLDEEEIHVIDPRWVKGKQNGWVYLTHISHLRVFRSRDGRSIDREDDVRLVADTNFEAYGVEDPRITKIEDTYYITYVAVSKHGAATALASTKDFKTFDRHGIIFAPENKDVILFPEKINNEYAALHRPTTNTQFSPPEMWLANSPDLIHWGKHRQLRTGSSTWESGKTGGGTPPVRVDGGWLEIYHGNRTSEQKHVVGAYSAGALLLDREHPGQILKQSEGAIMEPKADFETQGFVPNVVFPTGIVDRGEVFQIYYGAADTVLGMVEFDKKELLGSLK